MNKLSIFRLIDNNFVNLILWLVILFCFIILTFYLLDWFLKWKPYLVAAKRFLLRNVFFLLLPIPALYLVYYYGYYTYPDPSKGGFFMEPTTANYLKDISVYFFGAGALSAALKTYNNLIFFKKQFKEVVESEEFSEVLSKKLQVLALSDDYLTQRTDLHDIWARVTICKYQQKFKELGSEIKKKMHNDFFSEDSLNYYYKNFRLQVNFSLEGHIVKIVEISSFTVVSHSNEKIELNFGTFSRVADNEEIYTKIIGENCKRDGIVLALSPEDTGNEHIPGVVQDVQIKLFKAELEGQTKYVIAREIEMTQNINEDRVYSFSASRIIEDLSVNLKHENDLKLFFSPVGRNVFTEDNHLRSENSESYICRDLMLPGEKFKVFIYKKG